MDTDRDTDSDMDDDTTRRRRGPFAGRITWVAAVCLATSCQAGQSDDSSPVTSPASAATPTAATTDPDSPVQPEGSGGGAPSWTLVSVTDGDTLDVSGPEGVVTVRLIGINAPEAGECFADEATAALRWIVGPRPLVLVEDVSDVDQFGRTLRYVETADGVDVGAELVHGGFAIARRYDPDVARSDRYDTLQAEAEAAGRGVWSPTACGSAAPAASIDVDIRFDADGNDNENLNDEWVRFTNTASAPIDLRDWTVADEARHRYRFGDVVLAPGASVTLYTGCGQDGADAVYWCNTESAVWNNDGDTVFLRDPSGNNVVVERYDGR